MAAQDTNFFAWSAHFRTRSPPKRDADSAKTRSETARFFACLAPLAPARHQSAPQTAPKAAPTLRPTLIFACARHESAPQTELATSKLRRFSRAPLR